MISCPVLLYRDDDMREARCHLWWRMGIYSLLFDVNPPLIFIPVVVPPCSQQRFDKTVALTASDMAEVNAQRVLMVLAVDDGSTMCCSIPDCGETFLVPGTIVWSLWQ